MDASQGCLMGHWICLFVELYGEMGGRGGGFKDHLKSHFFGFVLYEGLEGEEGARSFHGLFAGPFFWLVLYEGLEGEEGAG